MMVDLGVLASNPIADGVALSMLGGAIAWARSITKGVGAIVGLTEKVTELAADVRDLAVTSTDVALTRAELRAHVSQADERWRMLGGIAPHPRYIDPDPLTVPVPR